MAVRMIVAVMLLGVAGAAFAEDDCAAEVARLCPASRGDLLVLGCLRANSAALSRVCKGDPDALLAKARQVGSSCDADAAKLCKEVQAGEGRIVSCLRDNESSLSTSCQAAFNKWRLMRMNLQSACAGEIGKLCQMVPEGSGRIYTCLKEHEKDLGSDCRSALNKL